MRISTNQIYDNGVASLQRGQYSLNKLQNQLSSAKRVLTPEDDPVAAAQALIVTQSKDVNTQHADNQKTASGQLGLVDSQLNSLVELLQNVRVRVVQAGNTGTLGSANRESIATELESRLSEMVGIANSQNGAGDYLFSGYKGATSPFAIDASTSDYAYYGDDGERLLQVSSSRQMAINVAGSDIFMNSRAGNGTFVTATGNNMSGGINKGSATIDAGSVLDQQKWALAVNNPLAGQPLEIRFSVLAGVTTYGIYDPVSNATSVPVPNTYTPGMAVSLKTSAGVDFGSQVVVSGQPQDGDRFTVKPSSSQSMFQTMQSLVGILRSPVGSASYTATEYSNALGAQLTNIDQAIVNVGRVQATVGSRMNELDALANTSSDLDIQYQTTLEDLVGLDYYQAMSDFTMQKTALEAAQKSFVQISGLSLFDYL